MVPVPRTTTEDRSPDVDDGADRAAGGDTADAAGPGLPEPGPDCDAEDVLRLGPLTVAGAGCDTDPWKTEQLRDAAARGDD